LQLLVYIFESHLNEFTSTSKIKRQQSIQSRYFRHLIKWKTSYAEINSNAYFDVWNSAKLVISGLVSDSGLRDS